LPPFSASGDINDAPFPMPDYIVKSLNLHISSFSLTQSSSTKLRNAFESDIFIRPIEQPFTRVLFNPVSVDDECTYGICTQKLELLDGSSQSSLNRHTTTDSNPSKTMHLPLVSLDMSSFNDIVTQKHLKLDNSKEMTEVREDVDTNSFGPYTRPTREQLNVYLTKFSQQMNENAIQFEKFCSTAAK
jgi:hypothetical protein